MTRKEKLLAVLSEAWLKEMQRRMDSGEATSTDLRVIARVLTDTGFMPTIEDLSK